MYKITPYINLFIAVSLLQVLFFNNLMLSVWLSPLVYVAFVLLLPLQLSQFAVLMAGLGIGVTMDWAAGGAGVNTIATLFVAFCRPYILSLTVSKEVLAGAGVPSGTRLGENSFAKYLILFVIIHHAIFFALDSLSLQNWGIYALRFVVSSAASSLFVWLIARTFIALTFKKVS